MEDVISTTTALLVGSEEWCESIRKRCPEILFEEHRSIPETLPESTVGIVERRQLLGTTHLPSSCRLLVCDQSQVGESESVIPIDSSQLTDSYVRSFLNFHMPLAVEELQESLASLDQRVKTAVEREFLHVLRDVLCNVLESQIEMLNHQKQGIVGFLDLEEYVHHLAELKSIIASYPSTLPVSETIEPSTETADFISSFYLCEMTHYLWTHREEGLFDGKKRRFKPRLSTSHFDGPGRVRCNQVLLIELFLTMFIIAPRGVLQIQYEATDTAITVRFGFPLKKPEITSLSSLVEDNFVSRFRSQIPVALAPFGAELSLSETSHPTFTFVRA